MKRFDDEKIEDFSYIYVFFGAFFRIDQPQNNRFNIFFLQIYS